MVKRHDGAVQLGSLANDTTFGKVKEASNRASANKTIHQNVMVIDVFILCQGPTNVRFASYEQTTGKIRFKTRRKAWVMRLAYNEAHNLLITPQQAQLRKLQPCLSNSYGLAHREKFEQECSPCVQKSTVDFAGLRHQKKFSTSRRCKAPASAGTP